MRDVSVCVLLALAGCSVQPTALTNASAVGSGACDGARSVSLDDLWLRYLDDAPTSTRGGCAVSGCHLDGAGGLSFASPAQFAAATIGVPAQSTAGTRVTAGDPLHSVLYQKLTASAPGDQMPPGGPYLEPMDLDDVRGWICAGAPSASQIDAGSGGDGGVVGGDQTPPTFAGASSATPIPNAITLAWSAASDNVTPASQIVYLVYQATSAGGESFATPTVTTAPGATSVTISKLAVSTRYYVVVRAQDAAGNLDGNTVEVSATTPATSDTQAPTFAGASAATVSGQVITVSWSAATDDYTPQNQLVYLVYQASSSGGEIYKTPTYTTAPGATSYPVAGVTPGVTAYFVVRAEDQAGNVSINTKEVSAATATVSFSSQVAPIFMASCTGSACHAGARPAQGLDLSSASTAYANLVNVLSSECTATERVAPGSTASSYLAWKLQGSGACFFGSKMPKIGSLSASDLDTILGWIAEGAPKN